MKKLPVFMSGVASQMPVGHIELEDGVTALLPYCTIDCAKRVLERSDLGEITKMEALEIVIIPPTAAVRQPDPMTRIGKAAKFDEIQKFFWNAAVNGNAFQSTIAAAYIRELQIPGPNGEDPEEA